MDAHTWWMFFVAGWLIALSPGSGAVLSMGHGVTYGVRGASATVLGLQAGLVGITLIAGGGVGALLMASATAFMAVKVLGAAYLMWLGWKQWNAPVQEGHSPLEDAAPQSTPQRLSAMQRFSLGALTNLTNPKGIVFMVAVLPQFMAPDQPLAPQLAVIVLTMCAIDTTVMHGYAWIGASLSRWLRSAKAQRTQNRVFGGVLMGMGASLWWVKKAV